MADQLDCAISKASIGINNYTPHGEAMMQLRKDLQKAVNVLGNRPPDYFRPNGHITPQQRDWHAEVERSARASLPDQNDQDE